MLITVQAKCRSDSTSKRINTVQTPSLKPHRHYIQANYHTDSTSIYHNTVQTVQANCRTDSNLSADSITTITLYIQNKLITLLIGQANYRTDRTS